MVVGIFGRTPPWGCFGFGLAQGASRDLWVSGVAPVSCFEHILTRVDLVTQPVIYLVFGYMVTCRFIIIIFVEIVMFGPWYLGILFGLEVVYLNLRGILELR